MKPEVEQLNASLNEARSEGQRTLYDYEDEVRARNEIEQALSALDVLWPDLQSWIRCMLSRLAMKRRCKAARS